MRYTVLVVDDEEDQRRALAQKTDWNSAGFELAGEAQNGVDALDKLEIYKPDLVITDIKMPMISGIELAAEIRRIRPATQIVFLSGYDSFEYAKSAIDYNVIKYLLKPVSSRELSRELFDIKERMDERLGNIFKSAEKNLDSELERLSVSEFLMPLMLGNTESRQDDAMLLKRAEELKITEEGENYGFCILAVKFGDDNNNQCTSQEHLAFIQNVISKYLNCTSLLIYARAITLVSLKNEEMSNALELPLRELVQTAQRVMNQKCSVGVSRRFERLSDCPEAYLQAIAARRYTSDGAGPVRFIDDQEPKIKEGIDYVEKNVMKLEQILKSGSDSSLENLIDSIYEKSTPENANLLIVQIVACVFRVVGVAADKSALSNLVESNPIFARITSYSSESVMKNELLHFCKSAKNVIEKSQRRDSEILCDKVLQIIESNYGDETLSLTSVSNLLSVSPNYLSTLIKKVTGENFITLLTKKRMEAAHDMLVFSNMKVLEISEKCGYSDQHYFSYCFKKFYGVSPNKIRTGGSDE